MKEKQAMANLGFVGLGTMGGTIAKRLLDAGHTVTGYNRTREKAQWLLDAGMQWGETPRQVAETADITFSMVSNSNALQEIVNGDDGILAALKPGKLYVDISTASPTVSREIAAQVAATGAQMLDAPISGNLITLADGSSSFMVGGDPAAFEQIKPILLDVGAHVTYIGGNGQALVMKIAINLSLPIQMLSLSEGILLAEKNGVPRKVAIDAWLKSAAAAPATKHRAELITDKEKEGWFDVNMMQKDMHLALDLAKESGVPLPTTAVTDEFLTAAKGMGWEKEDFVVIFDVLATLAGVRE
jgi:3-hydroxyisobutyrate dehydrogenase-like beta-hydroxyacid dehydrogenase